MKKVLTDKGWNEITTSKVEITLLVLKPFMTAGGWVEFTEKRPQLNKGGRNHCECCNVKWADVPPESNTYFTHSTKGNKIMCETCFKTFLNNEEIKRI